MWFLTTELLNLQNFLGENIKDFFFKIKAGWHENLGKKIYCGLICISEYGCEMQCFVLAYVVKHLLKHFQK
jgi:hypothetical protein